MPKRCTTIIRYSHLKMAEIFVFPIYPSLNQPKFFWSH